MANGVDSSVLATASLIVSSLVALAKVSSMFGRAKSVEDDKLWTRRDEFIDDLRKDIDLVRQRLRDRDRECDDLRRERDEARRERDECWHRHSRFTPPDSPRGSRKPNGGTT